MRGFDWRKTHVADGPARGGSAFCLRAEVARTASSTSTPPLPALPPPPPPPSPAAPASGAARREVDAAQATLEHGHLQLHTARAIGHNRADGLPPYGGLLATQAGAGTDRNGHEAGGQWLVEFVASADFIYGCGREFGCEVS